MDDFCPVMTDDFAREVYCILGLPIDAVEMSDVVGRIEAAAIDRSPLFISTPNLNFLVYSQNDPDFRESLLISDLCPPDGISILLIAHFLGIPLKSRVAGADLVDALKVERPSTKALKLFLFGGLAGAGEAAARTLNDQASGVCCVDTLNPGFSSVEEMSTDAIIERINASNAEFLIAALGAKKGQLWLKRNRSRISIPIRSHLGAAINYQAGTVKRSPVFIQKLGFEWAWRIKEEPHLWRRYWKDGLVLLRLLLTRIFPLALSLRWLEMKYDRPRELFAIEQRVDEDANTVTIFGPAIARYVEKAIPVFRAAATMNKRVIVDFSRACAIDLRFLGLLFMLRKALAGARCELRIVGLSPRLRRIFRLSAADFMLTSDFTPLRLA